MPHRHEDGPVVEGEKGAAPPRLVCGRCGSWATHQVLAGGMPTPDFADQVDDTPWQRLGGCLIIPDAWLVECLTCGRRQYPGDGELGFEQQPAPDRTISRAVTEYAARCRETLGQAQAPVISHVGLWLLLASVAEHVAGHEAKRLGGALGMPAADASAAARALLTEPHPTLAAAVGAWAATTVTTPLPDVDRPIPDQETLDRWAAEHTRGLIERFPTQVDDLTQLLLTTGLVLEPRWVTPLSTDDDGALLLTDGLQTIIRTEAAGLVAVVKPFSEDAVDVLSVIAAPDVPPVQVWRAVDEVVARLADGDLWHGEMPADTPQEGHAWSCWTEHTVLARDRLSGLPADWLGLGRRQMWSSRLPVWAANDTIDLRRAPGVREVAAALLPEQESPAFGCVQAVRAEYDEDGFRAAAITALMSVTGAPDLVEAAVRRVELDLTGPHALVAIARGGAWEGVPLVSAWVTPTDP